MYVRLLILGKEQQYQRGKENNMALIKEKYNGNVRCEYHTPIIMQNGKKATRVAVSTWIDEKDYKDGNMPQFSRVDAVAMDNKYPTAEEIYAKLTKSRLDEEDIETNWYTDAVSDEK